MKNTVRLLLLSFWMAAVSSAQTFSGTIEGIVKDSSGAVMGGVSVTVKDVDTGATFKTVTNGSGNYLASFLNPSKYSATFEKDGFQQTVVKDLALDMNGRLRVDCNPARSSPSPRRGFLKLSSLGGEGCVRASVASI